jgi:hypothetical protein
MESDSKCHKEILATILEIISLKKIKEGIDVAVVNV